MTNQNSSRQDLESNGNKPTTMPTVIQTNLTNITVRKSDISDAIKLSTKRDVVIIVERAHALELIEAIKKEMEV